MSKHDKMADVCEALIDHPVHKRACAVVGIDRRTFYRWMNSDPTDSDLIFEWHGKTAHFTQHVARAMQFNKMENEGYSREMWREGFEEIVTKDGKICYYEDEDIINAGYGDADSATLMLLFGQPDTALRDPVTHHRIPIKVRRAPPAALINKMLSAHFPKVYGETSTVNVNQQGHTSVLIVGGNKPALPKPVDVTPAVIAQIPPVKVEDTVEHDIIEEAPEPENFGTLPPDFPADTEDEGPPIRNAEPPLPPKKEPEPVEFTTPQKKDEKPVAINPPPTLSEKAAAARARLQAQADDLERRRKAGHQSISSLPIDTGTNRLQKD